MADVRLIDENALYDTITDVANSVGHDVMAVEDVHRCIDKAPTIDAVPVVHSSWGYRAYRGDARITVSGEVVCRKCHAPFFRIRGHWLKYCPNCGAKMDAKEG